MNKRDQLTLNDIFSVLTGSSPLEGERPVSSIVIDSRKVMPGSVFVALPGEQTDGHLYVGDAFARGAVAAIVQKPVMEDSLADCRQRMDHWPVGPIPVPVCLLVENSLDALQKLAAWWRARFDVRTIGITGSVGKTTTKEFVASVLAQRYRILKNVGSYNNEIGLPLTLLQLSNADQYVVLEMGTYGPGEITQLARIARPHIGLVTNVGPVHLERMGTIERIAEAKSELLRALPSDGIAILNGDDERVRSMAAQTQARVFLYGLTPDCDLWADDVESHGLDGLCFRFHHRGETAHVQVPLLGSHSIHTALRAASVGLVEGLSWDEIVRGLHSGELLRLVAVSGINGSILLDDSYNSSPDSAIAALNLLQELEGRKVAVLGDMLELGSYTAEGHRQVGQRAAEVVSLLITVGELGRLIGQEAIESGMPAEHVIQVADSARAIARSQDLIRQGDVVLIKGSRGMRMEQIVSALARPSANSSLAHDGRPFDAAHGRPFDAAHGKP